MITIGHLKQALVRSLRSIPALKAAVGSDGIYEGIALHDAKYPFVTYSFGPIYRSRQFGDEGIIKTTVGIWVVSNDQVEAHNLDQLILEGIENADLDFTDVVPSGSEPSTLLFRRHSDMSSSDIDEAGNKVYQVGGTSLIWLDRL